MFWHASGRVLKSAAMNLADARTAVANAVNRMQSAYGRAVFDEWVLVSLRADRGAILAYDGPRPDTYKQQFTLDLSALLHEIATQRLSVGDFAFATSAESTRYDACLRAGESSYLFCNHTQKTMTEIRQSPTWLAAQKVWVELAAKFGADPLE